MERNADEVARKRPLAGGIRVTEIGRYRYTIEAWADRFKSWQSDLLETCRGQSAARSGIANRRRIWSATLWHGPTARQPTN